MKDAERMLEWVALYVTEIIPAAKKKGFKHTIQISASDDTPGNEASLVITRGGPTIPAAFIACVRAGMRQIHLPNHLPKSKP